MNESVGDGFAEGLAPSTSNSKTGGVMGEDDKEHPLTVSYSETSAKLFI